MAKDIELAHWTASDAWDVLLLEGERVPGVARVKVKMPAGLDVRKAQGKRKGRVVDVGQPPTEIDIEIELLPEQLDDFYSTIARIAPRVDGAARAPVKIDHPQARLWRVAQVMIGAVHSAHPDPGGTLIVSIEAVEYRAPQPVKKKGPAVPVQEGKPGYSIDQLIDENDPARPENVMDNFSAPRDYSGTFDPVTPADPSSP